MMKDTSYNLLVKEKENVMSLIDGNSEMPVGFGMKLALDMQAMNNYANLPDQNKLELIDYIKGSTTGDEAKNRVTEVVNNLHNGNSFR